jgi:hypothetical protein
MHSILAAQLQIQTEAPFKQKISSCDVVTQQWVIGGKCFETAMWYYHHQGSICP